MPLTDSQKRSARFDGGKPLANSKSHLARVRSALDSLVDPAASLGHIGLSLTTEDRQALASAAAVVDRLTRDLAKNVAAARAIKKAYDSAIASHTQALRALARTVADTVALAGLAEPHRDICDVATECERAPRWAKSEVDTLRRDAVAVLADRMTTKDTSQAAQIAQIAADLPVARARHADVIARINAALVRAELERATA